jgi:hypothetical protein
VLDQFRVVLRRAEAAREGHARGERVLHLLGHAEEHGRAEDAGRDGHVADITSHECTVAGQQCSDDAAVGDAIGRVAGLAVVDVPCTMGAVACKILSLPASKKENDYSDI